MITCMHTFNRWFYPDSRAKRVQTSADNVNCSIFVIQENYRSGKFQLLTEYMQFVHLKWISIDDA